MNKPRKFLYQYFFYFVIYKNKHLKFCVVLFLKRILFTGTKNIKIDMNCCICIKTKTLIRCILVVVLVSAGLKVLRSTQQLRSYGHGSSDTRKSLVQKPGEAEDCSCKP